jgi:hypothetical protein
MLADLEGDDKEAARLIKAATQDRAEARTSFEQSVQTARGVMQGWRSQRIDESDSLARTTEQKTPTQA